MRHSYAETRSTAEGPAIIVRFPQSTEDHGRSLAEQTQRALAVSSHHVTGAGISGSTIAEHFNP